VNREPVLGLAPMLEALGIKQAASFNDCYALLGELFAVTRCSPKPSELSGNEWCALVNLALARHNLLNSAPSGAAAEHAEHAAQADARIAELEAALAKEERRAITFGDIVHTQVMAMRAAVVAWQREDAAAGMKWIANTLCGPGHLPSEEAIALGAQALFDKEMAEHEAFRAAHPGPAAPARAALGPKA